MGGIEPLFPGTHGSKKCSRCHKIIPVDEWNDKLCITLARDIGNGAKDINLCIKCNKRFAKFLGWPEATN